LYFVLINLSIILSPIIPFITEEIYTNLTGEKSVHLSCWPENLENKYYNQDLEKDMELIRQIVEIGRRVRKENKVKVRQPLAKVEIFVPQANRFINQSIKNDAISLIAKELNVKSVTIDFSDVEEIKVKFDFNLNEALIFEGEVRELIRRIQQERKLLQLSPDKPIVLQIPEKFRASADYIKRRVIASELIFADSLKITK
jgi:isoleucyl-tRNA synthetase